jgi:glutathione S-transferase
VFTIVGWTRPLKIKLTEFAALSAYMDRIAARPKVRDAMRAEGLLLAA